jgi:hypothetical protein
MPASDMFLVDNRRMRMLFAGGFSFANFLMDVMTLFAFLIWFWLAISVFGDLFRREDISGWGKAFWVIGVILFPYIGVLAYMISQGKGMAQRSAARVQQARENLKNVIGFSVADEIEKLDRLKHSGSITEGEFTDLRAKLVKAA